ncbi:MAG TPA: HepT-like ribonuclease domain-containing protein [Pedobacter sp.]|uniref:HepT-like ribonuclease domain-containing protein n=1 Tax=Pedobacter sp. TaxID=1411316 RepID=UPI002C31CAAD|nr:HepT-like ribonuclease domain-containing protein [Pedobacter sp.]HMI03362.1 HepT-like ribonuclease domain-containing protein [Pedobacter sp.]
MLPSSIELVKHILDEVSFILTTVKGKDKESVIGDPVLSRAIIRSLEIVGEASTKLDPEFKAAYPHIEWRKMANTRHRLIHDYFGVDYDIVWDIITTKLPDLETDIQSIISEN